jgi:hypothetical protein
MRRTVLVTLPLLALAACGTSFTAADITAYQQDLAALTVTVTTHQDAGVATSPADCAAEHRRYDDAARPVLRHMLGMSQGMDDCRQAMGHAGPFELHGMCGSMQTELDRHAAAACSPDAGANHAEVAHHCQLMRDWLGQQQGTATAMGQMGSMMRGGHCAP